MPRSLARKLKEKRRRLTIRAALWYSGYGTKRPPTLLDLKAQSSHPGIQIAQAKNPKPQPGIQVAQLKKQNFQQKKQNFQQKKQNFQPKKPNQNSQLTEQTSESKEQISEPKEQISPQLKQQNLPQPKQLNLPQPKQQNPPQLKQQKPALKVQNPPMMAQPIPSSCPPVNVGNSFRPGRQRNRRNRIRNRPPFFGPADANSQWQMGSPGPQNNPHGPQNNPHGPQNNPHGPQISAPGAANPSNAYQQSLVSYPMPWNSGMSSQYGSPPSSNQWSMGRSMTGPQSNAPITSGASYGYQQQSNATRSQMPLPGYGHQAPVNQWSMNTGMTGPEQSYPAAANASYDYQHSNFPVPVSQNSAPVPGNQWKGIDAWGAGATVSQGSSSRTPNWPGNSWNVPEPASVQTRSDNVRGYSPSFDSYESSDSEERRERRRKRKRVLRRDELEEVERYSRERDRYSRDGRRRSLDREPNRERNLVRRRSVSRERASQKDQFRKRRQYSPHSAERESSKSACYDWFMGNNPEERMHLPHNQQMTHSPGGETTTFPSWPMQQPPNRPSIAAAPSMMRNPAIMQLQWLEGNRSSFPFTNLTASTTVMMTKSQTVQRPQEEKRAQAMHQKPSGKQGLTKNVPVGLFSRPWQKSMGLPVMPLGPHGSRPAGRGIVKRGGATITEVPNQSGSRSINTLPGGPPRTGFPRFWPRMKDKFNQTHPPRQYSCHESTQTPPITNEENCSQTPPDGQSLEMCGPSVRSASTQTLDTIVCDVCEIIMPPKSAASIPNPKEKFSAQRKPIKTLPQPFTAASLTKSKISHNSLAASDSGSTSLTALTCKIEDELMPEEDLTEVDSLTSSANPSSPQKKVNIKLNLCATQTKAETSTQPGSDSPSATTDQPKEKLTSEADPSTGTTATDDSPSVATDQPQDKLTSQADLSTGTTDDSPSAATDQPQEKLTSEANPSTITTLSNTATSTQFESSTPKPGASLPSEAASTVQIQEKLTRKADPSTSQLKTAPTAQSKSLSPKPESNLPSVSASPSASTNQPVEELPCKANIDTSQPNPDMSPPLSRTLDSLQSSEVHLPSESAGPCPSSSQQPQKLTDDENPKEAEPKSGPSIQSKSDSDKVSLPSSETEPSSQQLQELTKKRSPRKTQTASTETSQPDETKPTVSMTTQRRTRSSGQKSLSPAVGLPSSEPKSQPVHQKSEPKNEAEPTLISLENEASDNMQKEEVNNLSKKAISTPTVLDIPTQVSAVTKKTTPLATTPSKPSSTDLRTPPTSSSEPNTRSARSQSRLDTGNKVAATPVSSVSSVQGSTSAPANLSNAIGRATRSQAPILIESRSTPSEGQPACDTEPKSLRPRKMPRLSQPIKYLMAQPHPKSVLGRILSHTAYFQSQSDYMRQRSARTQSGSVCSKPKPATLDQSSSVPISTPSEVVKPLPEKGSPSVNPTITKVASPASSSPNTSETRLTRRQTRSGLH